jgi:hypothetical protein
MRFETLMRRSPAASPSGPDRSERGWSLILALAVFFGLAFLVQPWSLIAAPALIGATIENLGETTTNDEHLVRDVSDAVTYMDEAAQVPLDQMLRRARRRKPAENIIIEWENVDRTPPRRDTIASASTGHGAQSTETLDVNNGAMWRPSDLAWFPDKPNEPLLLVLAVNYTSNTIDVKALPTISDMSASTKTRTGQNFETVPDVAQDDIIIRLTNSKTESDTPSPSRMTQPELFWNYIHTFDAVVKSSDHRQRTRNYTRMDDWQRGRADSLIDLRRSMEYNYFFGKPSITYDPGTNELRITMAGLLHYVNQSINYTISSGISESDIIDWHTEIYTGNTGRKNRLLFADKYLAGEIDKVMLAKMQHLPQRTIAGVQATELATRHGRTMVVHHPGFDELGKTHFGVVVDLAYLAKSELQSLDKREQDLKGSTGEDADQEQYIEKSGLEVSNAEVHYTIEGQ